MPTFPARVASLHLASMPREACIVAAGKFGDSVVLLKNRDRNYLPEVTLIHEVRDGVEVAYIKDTKTGWVEGINEYGIGVVNAALMVSRDESERDEVERTGKKLKDGDRILRALTEKTVAAAAKSVRTYEGGLKGHTLVSDGKKTLYVEMPDSDEVEYDDVPVDEVFVRTNHGVEFPDAGYVEGPREESSKSRQESAETVLAGVESPEEVAPSLLLAREDRWDPTEMVRDNKSKRKMRTTSQMVLDLTQKKLTFYILPGRVDFKGVEDKLPKGHAAKLTLEVLEYTDLTEDTDANTKKTTKKKAGLLPILDPAFNIREIFKQLVLLEDHLFHPRKRCPDCIWKHLLTCEAFAEEAVTLDVARKHTAVLDGLAERIRGLARTIQAKAPFEEVAQAAREIRKGLLPVASTMKVGARPIKLARTDVVNPVLVEKLRKEVLLLAKAVDAVHTLEQAAALRRAVVRWTEVYERFGSSIREDLEGRVREAKAYEQTGHRPTHRPLSDRAWAEWYLANMKPYWQLTTELWGAPSEPELRGQWGGSFEEPEQVRARMLEFYREKYPEEDAEAQVDRYFDRNPPYSREAAAADALARWKKDAEPWARRVREKARAAWKYLVDLSKWTERDFYMGGGGKEPVSVVVPDEENVTLEGFKLVFRGFEDSPYQDKLEALKAGLRWYKQRASQVLPVLLQKQLPMFIDWVFDPRESGTSGAYYETRYIRVTPWFLTKDTKKFAEMVAHEMGHHLYKTVIGDAARKFWDTAVRGDYGDLDLREGLARVRALGSGVSFFDKELAFADPVLFLQLQTLTHDPAYKYLDVWDVDSAQAYLNKGGNPIFRVPQHPITGYGGKNTEEAFCEAVGRLVAYGPLVLPEEVRGWLRIVLPTIKIAAEVPVQTSTEFAPFKVGDLITHGKFQNKPGKIVRMFVNEQGIPSIEVEAVGHARRKNRIMGLYRIRHMDMAKRVASRWAGTLLQFPTRAAPVRPKHTVTLGGKKYALSADGGPLGDQLEALSGDEGGAQVVDMPAFMKPEPYRFLWAYDTEDGSVSMWRVTDGNSKVWGSADGFASKIVELDRKGELNRVTSAEMKKLDRLMRRKEDEQLQSMKKWLAENATEYQKFVDKVAWDVFNRDVKPGLEKRLQEAKRGVVPIGFKVDESQLDYRSRGEQLRSHILTEETAKYTIDKVEDEVRSRGVDPEAPEHDIQAAYWALNDVMQEVWEKYSRVKLKVGYGPEFGPRQDLTQGFKFRVKAGYEGVLVRVYQGSKLVGSLLAHWSSKAKECQGDDDALRAKYPVLAKADVLHVWKSILVDEVQGKGIGRAMYQAAMAAGFKEKKGPILFTNTECMLGSGTSKEAHRVWTSIARQYPSSGDVIAVLRPPTIASRDLDPEQVA